jgi:hypothetical protein
MRGQFGAIEVLETTKNLQTFSITKSLSFLYPWIPKILVEQGYIFLNRGRKVSVLSNHALHASPFKVLNLIKHCVNPFL